MGNLITVVNDSGDKLFSDVNDTDDESVATISAYQHHKASIK
jgi:hypothetical protein